MDGIIVINKPAGMTSSSAVQAVRKIFPGSKAGHTGTLDPLATGVLPVCLGRATRLTEYIIELPKTYRAGIVLGKSTVTGDAEGEIIEDASLPELNREQVEEAVFKFKGEIEQLPPYYSAVKHRGKPLYHWTRKGKEVPRKIRRATIYDIELIHFDPGSEPHLSIRVECSKGTYIRTLAVDIGAELGCGAYLSALERTAVGPFRLEDAYTLPEAAEMAEQDRAAEMVQPMDKSLLQFPELRLESGQVEALKNGLIINLLSGDIPAGLLPGTPIRVYDREGGFKALAALLEGEGRPRLKTLKYLES